MTKTDKSLHSYLNSVRTELLTKEQEENLIKNVEVYQKEIVSKLVASNYARAELKSYLQSLESSGESIIDISKKLDEESSENLQIEIESKFKSLIKELSKSDNYIMVNNLLNDVSLSGTHIHGVVTEIKKKHSKIMDVEGKFKQVKKYFNTETDAQIQDQITSSSPELKSRIKSEYQLNDVKLNNKMSEWKNILDERNEVHKTLFSFTPDEVKSVYKNIADFEAKASKFKNELITKNLRLVISRAKKHVNKGLEFEDLIQEGNIGLMKAVDKFDSSKKTKISTYATWWIDQSIKRAISNKGKTVRVPTHIEWMETNLKKIEKKLTNSLGREPTLKEMAEASKVDIKILEDLQTRAQHEIGLDEELQSGVTLSEILPSDPNESPFTVVEQKLLKEKIRHILSTLPPRTEKIIRLRFGIGEIPDDEGTTLQAIADQVGITKQGVRVIECSAFRMLKKKAKRLAHE